MPYSLPTKINIGGKAYNISKQGDYRMVIDCFKALNDCELSQSFRYIAALMIFYEDINSIEDVKKLTSEEYKEFVNEMFNFLSIGHTVIGIQTRYKLIDWNKDEQIICAAVNNVAKMEVRSVEYMHWYTFSGHLMSDSGNSTLAVVVSVRDKIAHGKKLEKYEEKFKKDNPHYFNWEMRTAEEIEEEQEFLRKWKSGSL